MIVATLALAYAAMALEMPGLLRDPFFVLTAASSPLFVLGMLSAGTWMLLVVALHDGLAALLRRARARRAPPKALVLVLVLLVVAVASVPLSAAPVRAVVSNGQTFTVNIAPTADTYIDSGNKTTNFGSSTILNLENNVNRPTWDFEDQILIFFPVTSIPQNAVLSSAVINLFPFSETFGGLSSIAVDTYTNAATFTEGTATWNSPGTGLITQVGFQIFTPQAFTGAPLGLIVTSTVQNQVSGAAANHGFSITFDSLSVSNAVWQVFSKEIAYANGRPYMTVTYSVPQVPVYLSYFCLGGPCGLNVQSGDPLPGNQNVSYSLNGNSTSWTPTGNSAVAATNLQLAYNMDTLNGSKMRDFSGLAVPNDGTITGTTVVAGKYGNARSFGGTSADGIASPSMTFNLGTTAYSFCAWVNPVYHAPNPAFASWLVNSQSTNVGMSVADLDGGSHWGVKMWMGGTASTTGSVAYGSWTSICTVYAGAGSTTRTLYVNGRSAGTDTSGATATFTGAVSVGGVDGYTQTDGGAVDQVETLARALSAPEALDLGTGAPYTRTYSTGFNANLTQPATVVVRDFFGNELYNVTRTIASNPTFWDVGLTYRLLELANFRDAITRVFIAPQGARTPMTIDLVGRMWWVQPLHQGVTFYLNFTLLDLNFNTVTTISLLRTMTTPVDYIVNGTSIDQVTVNVNGVDTNLNKLWGTANLTQAYLIQQWAKVNNTFTNVRFSWSFVNRTWLAVNVSTGQILAVYNQVNGTWTLLKGIAFYITPPMILAGNLPYAPRLTTWAAGDLLPANGNVAFDPFQTLRYTVNRSKSGTNFIVGPVWNTGATVVFVLSDVLYIAGTWTHLWINDTKNTSTPSDDTPIVNTANPLNYYSGLAGQNLTVKVAGSSGITVNRVSQIQIVSTFSWTQDLKTRLFTYTANIANNLNVSWTSVQDYVSYVPGFPADPSTIVVTDITNNVVLSAGVNYVVTSSGIGLELTSVGASTTRAFQIQYAQVQNSSTVLEPPCSAGNPQGGTYNNKAYVAIVVTCTNQNTISYIGPLHFILTTAQAIDHATVIVVQGTGGGTTLLPGQVYWSDATTLVATGQGVASRTQVTYTVYFQYVPQALSPQFWIQLSPYIALALLIGSVVSGAIAWNIRDRPDTPASKRRREIALTAFTADTAILIIVVVVSFLLH